MTAQRGRLGAYALWQLRDYCLTVAGAGSLLLPFVIGVFPLLVMKYINIRNGGNPGQLQNVGLQSFDALVSAIAWIGAMLSIVSMVSADRQPGLTRFLFAKPIPVPAYYLQAWVVRGTALAAFTLLLTQIVNLLVLPVPWVMGIASVAIAWVLIGGVGFLLSVLTSRDGLSLVALYLVVVSLDGARQSLPTLHWVKWVMYVLPPMQKLEVLRHALLRGTPLPMGDFWHVIAYGAACTALATYLVRRLPLVR
jgi:hypothetical protein